MAHPSVTELEATAGLFNYRFNRFVYFTYSPMIGMSADTGAQ